MSRPQISTQSCYCSSIFLGSAASTQRAGEDWQASITRGLCQGKRKSNTRQWSSPG